MMQLLRGRRLEGWERWTSGRRWWALRGRRWDCTKSGRRDGCEGVAYSELGIVNKHYLTFKDVVVMSAYTSTDCVSPIGRKLTKKGTWNDRNEHWHALRHLSSRLPACPCGLWSGVRAGAQVHGHDHRL